MNRKGVTLQSVAISGTMLVVVILVSPFMFELFNLTALTGVEGFFAKLVPFVMLWTALRAGAFAGIGQ